VLLDIPSVCGSMQGTLIAGYPLIGRRMYPARHVSGAAERRLQAAEQQECGRDMQGRTRPRPHWHASAARLYYNGSDVVRARLVLQPEPVRLHHQRHGRLLGVVIRCHLRSATRPRSAPPRAAQLARGPPAAAARVARGPTAAQPARARRSAARRRASARTRAPNPITLTLYTLSLRAHQVDHLLVGHELEHAVAGQHDERGRRAQLPRQHLRLRHHAQPLRRCAPATESTAVQAPCAGGVETAVCALL